MLMRDYMLNSTQCELSVTLCFQTSVSILNMSALFSSLSISSLQSPPLLAGSITKRLIQDVHSEAKHICSYIQFVCLWILLRNRDVFPAHSLAFKTACAVECDSPWAAKSSWPAASSWCWRGEQPASHTPDEHHPITCSRMRSFTQRWWSMLNGWKRCVSLCR